MGWGIDIINYHRKKYLEKDILQGKHDGELILNM